MDEPLDEAFFKWLYSQVADPNDTDPRRTYWKLLQKLYSVECVWVVINDGNRLEDGKNLRLRFRDETGTHISDQAWLGMGCSFFELMVELSNMLVFEADGELHQWFWKLMENIGLDAFNDREFDDAVAEVVDVVTEHILFRQYERNGHGGFFPLKHPQADQRDVELWYQMSAYILELEQDS